MITHYPPVHGDTLRVQTIDRYGKTSEYLLTTAYDREKTVVQSESDTLTSAVKSYLRDRGWTIINDATQIEVMTSDHPFFHRRTVYAVTPDAVYDRVQEVDVTASSIRAAVKMVLSDCNPDNYIVKQAFRQPAADRLWVAVRTYYDGDEHGDVNINTVVEWVTTDDITTSPAVADGASEAT